jgi:hypothetical protein
MHTQARHAFNHNHALASKSSFWAPRPIAIAWILSTTFGTGFMLREDKLSVVDTIHCWAAPIAMVASALQAATLRATVIFPENEPGVVQAFFIRTLPIAITSLSTASFSHRHWCIISRSWSRG